MHTTHRHASLALALAVALAGNAAAQTTPKSSVTTPTPAQQKELEAARSEMTKAAQHYAELARKYQAAGAPVRIERREVRRPVIGVLLAGDDKPGVRIVGVTPDSAAAGAGLKGGDRILRIDGKVVDATNGEARVAQARAFLATRTDGKTPVMVMYERDGKPATATMTPKDGDRLFVISDTPEGLAANGNVHFFTSADGKVGEIHANRITIDSRDLETKGRLAARAAADAARAQAGAQRSAGIATMVAPEVRREIIRIDNDCKDGACRLAVLSDAIRWNGLNLASVDAGLGRYFGTDSGVLVIGTGKDLQGLQAGDVIRAINGKPVNTPREAMDVLRPLPAGGKASVDYLRDRKPATAQVTIPDVPPQLRVLTPGATGVQVERRKVMEIEDRSHPVAVPATPKVD